MLHRIEPIDYLIIGHLTQDLTPQGYKLGGTAAYAARTAQAFGARVGIVTSTAEKLEFPELEGTSIRNYPSEYSTTFKNIQTPNGRIQHVIHVAQQLDISMVPDTWRSAPMVHLGPVANEVDPYLASSFPGSFLGVTPQGWMRGWAETGKMSYKAWDDATYVLPFASAAVLSIEDVEKKEERILELLPDLRILAVTDGARGARVYWNGELKQFFAPNLPEVDPTGAGDIFAAAFFIRLFYSRDPWDAAKLAIKVASNSITRQGLSGAPTAEEVHDFLLEARLKEEL